MFDKADFSTLRHTQPQWVIDQLVEQTTKQGTEIHRLMHEAARLTSKVGSLNTDLARVQGELDALRAEAEQRDAETAEQKELI